MEPNELLANAKKLRERQTKAELLLWSALRAKQFCNLKFRRQYPIPPYIADFACLSHQLIIELDGGYHDYQGAEDKTRQRLIESSGWRVLRYTNEDVLNDVQIVLLGVAKTLGVEVQISNRHYNVSGMLAPREPSPGRYRVRPLPQAGEVT